jgi:hypothetical protein
VRRVLDWLAANGFQGFAVEYVVEHAGCTLRVAIDIAFPESRIGVEVNGKQHYGPAFGMTEEEWQERHERERERLALKQDAGWAIFELDGRDPDWAGLSAWLRERI